MDRPSRSAAAPVTDEPTPAAPARAMPLPSSARRLSRPLPATGPSATLRRHGVANAHGPLSRTAGVLAPIRPDVSPTGALAPADLACCSKVAVNRWCAEGFSAAVRLRLLKSQCNEWGSVADLPGVGPAYRDASYPARARQKSSPRRCRRAASRTFRAPCGSPPRSAHWGGNLSRQCHGLQASISATEWVMLPTARRSGGSAGSALDPTSR